MNLFILAEEPELAAQYHCDKHVVKMILETAQMLCTAHHTLDGDAALGKGFYKCTHVNHPCSKWVRKTQGNYLWAYRLFRALCTEYTYRYGKVHLCEEKLASVLEAVPTNIPDGAVTPFAQAMPDLYVHPDPVTAYRKYYIGEKSSILYWTRRKRPYWATV